MDNLEQQFAQLQKKLENSVREVAVSYAQRAEEYLHTPEFTPEAMNPLASPVETGRYIASHRISPRQKDLSVAPRNADHVIDAPNVSELLTDFNLGDAIFLTNSVPYAGYLERNPSPLRKTPGQIYYTSAIAAVQEMKSGGVSDACVKVANSIRPATPARLELVI
jgi:hypothetical protein